MITDNDEPKQDREPEPLYYVTLANGTKIYGNKYKPQTEQNRSLEELGKIW